MSSKLKYLSPIIALITLGIPAISYAMCPICTLAVVGGVGLSRYLGIDDTVISIWIGALIISLTLWTNTWLEKRKYTFWNYRIIVFIAYIALVVIPLFYIPGMINHPFNKIWGMDKLLFGMVVGSLLFGIGSFAYLYSKDKNGGHAHFPFEKIVFAIGPLIIASIAFYFITR
jgi:hypothetical protein